MASAMPNSQRLRSATRRLPMRRSTHHHDRPDQVELLLDRQAPEVTERGEVVGGAVALAGVHLVPVRAVAERGDDVAAQLAERRPLEQRRPDREQEQHHEQRREQTAGPPDPEVLHVDVVRLLLLGDQQQRDQVAGDDEEHLDAEEPALQPVAVGVVDHHRHHGEGPHPVEARQVRDAADVRLDLGPRQATACTRWCDRRWRTSRSSIAQREAKIEVATDCEHRIRPVERVEVEARGRRRRGGRRTASSPHRCRSCGPRPDRRWRRVGR